MTNLTVETIRRELNAACAFLELVERRFGEPLDLAAWSVTHSGWRAEVMFFFDREYPSRDRLREIVEGLLVGEGFTTVFPRRQWWRRGRLDITFIEPEEEEAS